MNLCSPNPAPHGRGTGLNPANRFEPLRVEWEAVDEYPEEERPSPRTRFYRDATESVLVHNTSPDVGFEWGLNPYRGCEHGCAYCYARPFHEFLGFSAGLDFETRIMVKERAPELLRAELAAPGWRPAVLGMSGVTDCYQPVERTLRLTRGCLEVLAECRHPVGLITKNALVARDAALLGEMGRAGLARVSLSITTLDADLARRLEPRTSSPRGRLGAIRSLSREGVPVGVMVAPIIPGLNEQEIPRILQAAAEAGASFAGWEMLRLPHAVEQIFQEWLETHEPGKAGRILDRLRAVRGGALHDSQFGTRMRGTGFLAGEITKIFRWSARRVGLADAWPELRTDLFRRPARDRRQLELELG